MISSWFKRRWVSRDEYEAMKAEYEDKLKVMEGIVLKASEAVTSALERQASTLSVTQKLAEKLHLAQAMAGKNEKPN